MYSKNVNCTLHVQTIFETEYFIVTLIHILVMIVHLGSVSIHYVYENYVTSNSAKILSLTVSTSIPVASRILFFDLEP